MMVTDVTYNAGTQIEPVWHVYTLAVEDYRPGMSESEAAKVATRVNMDASAPGARGVENAATVPVNTWADNSGPLTYSPGPGSIAGRIAGLVAWTPETGWID